MSVVQKTLLILMLQVCCADGSSIISKYPFRPHDHQKATPDPAKSKDADDRDSTRFTLKGISNLGSEFYFSIHDSLTKKSKWIQAGVPYNGFSILMYDPSQKRIHFNWEGKSYSLKIDKPENDPIALVYNHPGKSLNASGPHPSSGDFNHQGRRPDLNSAGTLKGSYNPADGNYNAQHSTSGDFNQQGRRPGLNSAGTLKGSYNPAYRDYNAQIVERSIPFEQKSPQANHPFFTQEGELTVLFASTNIPASTLEQEVEIETPPQRYKVKRNNKVHNPNGKKPQHMSFAQWQAIKNK